MTPGWRFRPIPADGGRTGGDQAAMSFGDDLEVFIREVLQNCLDARADDARPVEVELRLTRLVGADKAAFVNAAGWPELAPHIAASESLFPALATASRRIEDPTEPLVVFAVEDRNAVGLSGPERGTGRFATFARNKLMSEKQSGAAAGSYGLGKSVLWRYAGFSTVFVHSRPIGTDGVESARFLGISLLPFHHVGVEEFDGPGWFGDVDSAWARSVRDPHELLLDPLGAARSTTAAGTTIVVPDFVPSHGESSLGRLGEEIEEHAARWFWPVLGGERPRMVLDVSVEEQVRRVDPAAHGLTAFLRLGGLIDDDAAGEVCSADLAVKLPATREEMDGVDGFESHRSRRVDDGVRLRLLASRSADANSRGRVALVRGAGMVVEYLDVPTGGVECHGLACAGTAVSEDADHRFVEQFLRTAEPPSHDTWTAKAPRLRERYKRGYASELTSLRKRIVETVRGLLLADDRSTAGEELPKALRKALSLPQGRSQGVSETRARFDFGIDECELIEDAKARAWRFSGWAHFSHDGAWQLAVECLLAGDTEGRRLELDRLVVDGVPAESREPARIELPGRVEFVGQAALPDDPIAIDASIWIDARARVAND